MRVAGEAITRQASIENGDLAACTAELQGGGEASKAAADDDHVIHCNGLRVVDGGGPHAARAAGRGGRSMPPTAVRRPLTTSSAKTCSKRADSPNPPKTRTTMATFRFQESSSGDAAGNVRRMLGKATKSTVPSSETRNTAVAAIASVLHAELAIAPLDCERSAFAAIAVMGALSECACAEP